ncbi:MAG TPA: GNAT family N-acetyltransferase [Intrasporangiaceae bacterium]|nr:GNAT family N-acetyltransferase [Intrasporangiaceae bacterium]
MPSDSTSAHPPGPRVVIRFRLPVPDPATGATLSDVVGDLVAATAEEIVVDSRHGRVTVPRSTVVATRVVPPRPSRRGAPHRALSVDDLERVMVGAWPPVERAALGRWLLRAAHGFTSRANSALVVGSPDRPVPEALTAVRQWYASRTLSARLAVPMPMGLDLAADPVAAAAIEAGWEPGDRVTVLTAASRTVVGACPSAPPPEAAARIEVGDRLVDDWLAGLRQHRAAPDGPARAVLTGSPEQRFALVRDGAGAVIAVARLGVSDGWGGIGAMWVAPDHRRQGLGRSMLGELARAATDLGCVSLHLQVEDDNDAAHSLYAQAGFTPHHSYAYLSC